MFLTYPGTIIGAATQAILPLVATKLNIIHSLSNTGGGVVKGVVEGVGRGVGVVADEGAGLAHMGLNFASGLVKVSCTEYTFIY